MDLERRRSPRKVSLRRRSSLESSNNVTRRRKSLLLQHSQSLNIPVEDLSQDSRLNCFTNIPDQFFSLTYLSENDTQNPESLKILEDFRYGNWQPYLAGTLYNFSYQPAQRKSLEKAITSGLRTRFKNSRTQMTFHTQVSRCKALSPTENDSEALQIKVVGRTGTDEQDLYMGYLMSWCSPVKESMPFLPLLLCQGNVMYRNEINSVISQKFDVQISKLTLSQEEIRFLMTYCLAMLDESENFKVMLTYKLLNGDTIEFETHVEYLLRLWKKIHPDDSIEIDSEEVILYHEALDAFYESTFGIKTSLTSFKEIKVSKCFCLHANSKMWFKSTKVIHVVLKYLNSLASKRLLVKVMERQLDEGNLSEDTSNISQ